ncbi:RasGEF [Clydaea vesicula]|uniref:RasGEF n=1 Tax=Clydaea vesicula TaxID=447962 RepID=A0AAD5U1L0_9FUNG|nr:RasGEF [Clydaea vesicula]
MRGVLALIKVVNITFDLLIAQSTSILEFLDNDENSAKFEFLDLSNIKGMLAVCQTCLDKTSEFFNTAKFEKPKLVRQRSFSKKHSSFTGAEIPQLKLKNDNLPMSPLLLMYIDALKEITDKTTEKNEKIQYDKPDYTSLAENSEKKKQKMGKILSLIQFSASSLSFLSFKSSVLAYRLCIIQQDLFCDITTQDFLLYRMVESTILEDLSFNDRAENIMQWIHIANKLLQAKNVQTCKAVVCALGTPPILRLKKTWPLVSKKMLERLRHINLLLSEQDNYKNLRAWMAENKDTPGIPFLGIFIQDLTYLRCLHDTELKEKRKKEILDTFENFKNGQKYTYEKFVASVKNISGFNIPKNGLEYNKLKGYLVNAKQMEKDSVGLLAHHWLLTRKKYSEKEIDEISSSREPKSKSQENFYKVNFTNYDGINEYITLDLSEAFEYLSLNNLDIPSQDFLNSFNNSEELYPKSPKMSKRKLTTSSTIKGVLGFGTGINKKDLLNEPNDPLELLQLNENDVNDTDQERGFSTPTSTSESTATQRIKKKAIGIGMGMGMTLNPFHSNLKSNKKSFQELELVEEKSSANLNNNSETSVSPVKGISESTSTNNIKNYLKATKSTVTRQLKEKETAKETNNQTNNKEENLSILPSIVDTNKTMLQQTLILNETLNFYNLKNDGNLTGNRGSENESESAIQSARSSLISINSLNSLNSFNFVLEHLIDDELMNSSNDNDNSSTTSGRVENGKIRLNTLSNVDVQQPPVNTDLNSNESNVASVAVFITPDKFYSSPSSQICPSEKVEKNSFKKIFTDSKSKLHEQFKLPNSPSIERTNTTSGFTK